ncbi:MAG TPA: tetratricopeptide repeat protein [Bryobacteraceae bacterium]|nr:tetratricopeptide repeat protein [Bryobacteraceae bacterium]
MYRFLYLLLFCLPLHAENVLTLPFFNHSNSANLDWIGESIAESVGDSLASEGVLVIDRATRLEAYSRLEMRPSAEITHASIIKIGQALDASVVIYGYYELLPPADGDTQSKGSLRVTARLLDLQHTRQGPPFGEVGALEDLANLEVHLGWQVLSFLHPQTAPSEDEFVKARPPVRIDAVENYIRGLLATAPEQRHRFFTQAARLDEHYSQPCFQLGETYWEKKDYKVAAGWLERVARKDQHYLRAQFFLGLCRFYNGDFSGAAQSFQIVAASVPLNEVFNNLGAAQSRLNEPAQAIASFQKASDGDSSDADYHFNIGYIQWREGHFDEAVTSLKAALAHKPNDDEATTLLNRALQREGPRPGDPKLEARERLKTNYDEAAYRQLQAALAK